MYTVFYGLPQATSSNHDFRMEVLTKIWAWFYLQHIQKLTLLVKALIVHEELVAPIINEV